MNRFSGELLVPRILQILVRGARLCRLLSWANATLQRLRVVVHAVRNISLIRRNLLMLVGLKLNALPWMSLVRNL